MTDPFIHATVLQNIFPYLQEKLSHPNKDLINISDVGTGFGFLALALLHLAN